MIQWVTVTVSEVIVTADTLKAGLGMQIFIVIVVGEPNRDSHLTAAPTMANPVGNDSHIVVYGWLLLSCF